ncbi:MAG: ATP-binding protein [Pseudomonadota bacterium]
MTHDPARSDDSPVTTDASSTLDATAEATIQSIRALSETDADSWLEAALHQLNALTPEVDFEADESIVTTLDLGRQLFDCEYGFVAETTNGVHRIAYCATPDDQYAVGATSALRDTPCAAVVNARSALASIVISDDTTTVVDSVIPPDSGFTAYLGAPLIVNYRIWGTLSFASRQHRAASFSRRECELLELMAARVAAQLQLARANSELSRNRDELRQVLDNVPARIWVKDDQNTILHANRNAAKSMGFDNPMALKNADTYALFPDMAAKYHRDDLEVLNSGKPLRNIVEPYTPLDGEHGWCRTDKIPLTVDGQRRLLVVASDITDMKLREQKLQQLNASLQNFASVAAHDLQAPLRQARLLVDLLANEIGADRSDSVAETLDTLSHRIDSMRDMVRSIYELAALESQTLSTAPVDLNKVLADILTQLKPSFDDLGVQFCAERLPTVVANGALLADVLRNLIENACKYNNSETPEIALRYERDASCVVHRFAIEDNGIGIAGADRERVFEPFRRCSSLAVDGTGIGLAFCRRVIQAHGGTIWVDPDAGDGGTRLIFELPYGQTLRDRV